MAASEQARKPGLDERLIPAGTTARFALVVILALVTTAKMVLEFAYPFTSGRVSQCELAAGIDPSQPGSDLSVIVARIAQAVPFLNCENRLAPPPPWWLPAGWPLLVLAVAVLFFHADRWWKLRGTRVRPLAEWDDPGSGFVISDEVRRLARQAGAETVLRCVVDITSGARAQSATVLGSTRRPVLCLHFGLVSQRIVAAAEGTDAPRFEAILRHELAHVRYGDITAARATTAVWQAFLTVALVPYLAVSVFLVTGGSFLGDISNGPVVQRDIITALALAVLGYLARSDVLRNREIYADREAVRNGADPRCWPERTPEAVPMLRRVTRALAELWRRHPSWELRAASLDDPVALFTVQALPMFLTGVAAALIQADFQSAVVAYGQNTTWVSTPWMVQAAGALSAALVTLIAGVALWRAVAYSRQERLPGPTGLRTGLWLGAGMIIGNLGAGQGTIGQLVPSRPEVLVLALAMGSAFGWWVAQCAGAWLAGLPGGIRSRAIAGGLAAGFLLMSWWFAFWAVVTPYSTGFSYSPSGFRRLLLGTSSGPAVHSSILGQMSWALPLVNLAGFPPATLLAVGAAWVVPLLAWVLRSPADPTADWPSLRTPIRWAAAGALLSWVGAAGAQAYMHATQPARPLPYGSYALAYSWLLFLALVLPAAVVALLVGLRRGRFRLLVTLIATEATVLAGLLGTLALVSADGCIRPLATLETSCAWRPGLIERDYVTLTNIPAALGAMLAFGVCALALARPAVRKAGRAGWSAAVATLSGRLRPSRRAPLLAATAALGIALAGIVIQFPTTTGYFGATGQIAPQMAGFGRTVPAVAPDAPFPWVATAEVDAWRDLGGGTYLNQARSDIATMVTTLKANHFTPEGYLKIGPQCSDLVRISQRSRSYFEVPDGPTRTYWNYFMNYANAGGRGCEAALGKWRTSVAKQGQIGSPSFWNAINNSFRQIYYADADAAWIQLRIKGIERISAISSWEAARNGHPMSLFGLLSVPPDAKPLRRNTGNLINLDRFVQDFYVRSSWKIAESRLANWGFVFGAYEGWIYPSRAQESIYIAQFFSARTASEWYSAYTGRFRYISKPWVRLTDPADGGVGRTYPALWGNTGAGLMARVGNYVIDVNVYTLKPDPGPARTLLHLQRESLERYLHSALAAGG